MKKSTPESRILTGIFFGPPILVALAVFGPWELHWLPRAEPPYGQRYDSPVVLPATSLETPTRARLGQDWARERWSLIFAHLSACDARCWEGLELLRQVRLALPRDRELVQRVYLYGGDIGALSTYPGSTKELIMGRIDGPAEAELRAALGEDDLVDGHFYISNPLGNLVFSYPLDAERQGILRDLQRLLTISRVN